MRDILTALAMMIAAIAFSVPVAASNTHRMAHGQAPVMTGQHHHHDLSTGKIDPQDEESEDLSGADDKEKGIGHNHASAAAGEFVTLGISKLVFRRLKQGHPPAWSVHALTTLTWSPHQRPPRTA